MDSGTGATRATAMLPHPGPSSPVPVGAGVPMDDQLDLALSQGRDLQRQLDACRRHAKAGWDRAGQLERFCEQQGLKAPPIQ